MVHQPLFSDPTWLGGRATGPNVIYPSRGGGCIKGGRYKIPVAGGFKIYTPIPPHPPLKNAFWPKIRGGGGGVYNFSLEESPKGFRKVLELWAPKSLKKEVQEKGHLWRMAMARWKWASLRPRFRCVFCDGQGLIFIHLQCWEVLPFSTIQRQRCIKNLFLKDPEFYTPLALNCQKGQHLPALEVYKNQSPRWSGNREQCTAAL